jgi:peptidylprolyl isomerase
MYTRNVLSLALALAFAPLAVAYAADPAPKKEAPAEAPKKDAVAPTEAPKKDMVAPAPKVVTTSSGLQYIDDKVGTGASPRVGQTVVVHYTGTFKDGKKFDSSRDRGEPIKFKLAVGQVIKGWDEGLMSMKVGGRRRLMIPANLAYGDRGAGGVIAPNTDLDFDVELVGVE